MNFANLKGTFTMVGSVLALIIGIIGILNFVNACITSIITRKKEFAALKAIGMTERQIRRMVCMEGGYYAAGVILFSLVLGTLFSYVVIGNFVSFLVYLLPVHYLADADGSAFMVVIGVVVPYITIKVTDKESVVEMLREE